MEFFSSIVCLFDDVIGWHLDEYNSAKHLKELFLCNLQGLLELGVLALGARCVPFRVASCDSNTESSRDVEPHLICLAYSVIESVYLQNQLLVKFLEYFF